MRCHLSKQVLCQINFFTRPKGIEILLTRCQRREYGKIISAKTITKIPFYEKKDVILAGPQFFYKSNPKTLMLPPVGFESPATRHKVGQNRLFQIGFQINCPSAPRYRVKTGL